MWGLPLLWSVLCRMTLVLLCYKLFGNNFSRSSFYRSFNSSRVNYNAVGNGRSFYYSFNSRNFFSSFFCFSFFVTTRCKCYGSSNGKEKD